jgi:outer membrane protein OmpA-like peptidoglycan-associated protein
MEDRQAPPLRNPSRTVAKVAVAVLIVIAVAGFVLAGLRSRGPAAGQSQAPDATQEGAAALTDAATAAASSAEDGVAANQIVFVPASAQLTDTGATKVLQLAEKAKKEHHAVAIVAKIEARADRLEQMDLARKRTLAIRQVLESNGIPLGTMRVEIAELPSGLVSAAEANRVEVAFH